MTDKYAGANRLKAELEKTIDYHGLEYDMSYAEILGVLKMVEAELIDHWHQRVDEENQADDEAEAA